MTRDNPVSAESVDAYRAIVKAATARLERGSCGKLGKGTPGKRLKSSWRPFRIAMRESLRAFVRRINKDASHPLHIDSITWMRSKGMKP